LTTDADSFSEKERRKNSKRISSAGNNGAQATDCVVGDTYNSIKPKADAVSFNPNQIRQKIASTPKKILNSSTGDRKSEHRLPKANSDCEEYNEEDDNDSNNESNGT